MARRRDPQRLSQLAATAVEHFIRTGYAGTQMDDVARTLGIAKGTLYLYVESKDALFDLAVRHAVGDRVDDLSEGLPLKTPRSLTAQRIQSELAGRARVPRLLRALTTDDVGDVSAEAGGIIGELYDLIDQNRVGLKLLDRCAREMPDLASLWYRQSREGVRAGLQAWLSKRMPLLAPLDPVLTSFFLMESIAFWAMHRHWDPAPPPVAEAAVRPHVVSLLVRAVTSAPDAVAAL